MELQALLVHAESGRRVVEVRAFDGSRQLGSALGEAADAEEAEDRARQRLLARLAQPSASQTTPSQPTAAEPTAPEAPVSKGAAVIRRDGVGPPGAVHPGVVSLGVVPLGALPLGAVPPELVPTEVLSSAQSFAEGESPPSALPPRGLNQPASARSDRPAGISQAGVATRSVDSSRSVASARRQEAEPPEAGAQPDGGDRSGEANHSAVNHFAGSERVHQAEQPAGSGSAKGEAQPARAGFAFGSDQTGGTNPPAGPLPAAGSHHPDGSPAVPAADRPGLPGAAARPRLASEPAAGLAAPPQEPPPDPEDWSSDLAALELQLRRLGWDREQEAIYLQRAFGHPSRNRLTNYSDLRAYLDVLERLAAGSEAASAAVPLRRSELLHQCEALLAQLGWNADQGRAFLERELQAASRQQLNDQQLLHFNMLLESEMLAATPNQAPVVT